MAFDIENFPTSELAKRSLEMVTQGFYDRSYVAKWLYQVMGLEMDDIQAFIDTMREQSFPETATWGLKYHEIKWGLPVRENLSYEERRKLIIAKRDFIAPMTPYTMEKYLKDAFDASVEVCDIHDVGEYSFEAPHPNVFRVNFIEEDGLNKAKIIKIVNSLKQSHTTFLISQSFKVQIDERETESFNLSDMLIKMRLPFWGDYINLDGSFLLDGSHLLDANINIDMPMGVIINSKVKKQDEQLGNVHLVKNSVGYWFLDGEYALDGSKKWDSYYEEEDL